MYKDPGSGDMAEVGKVEGNKVVGSPTLGCEKAAERWNNVPGRPTRVGTASNCGC